ncbi:MAG TPA: hypothetical protein VF432_18025 [Thermoanaerobaculia bacterium]
MKAKKNALEWTVFGASVAVIGAVVALLVHAAVTSQRDKRPALRVATREATREPEGYLVPVIVSNDGDATAEQARIRIALMAGSEEVEAAELMIAFVPRKSQREASVVFRRDPACCAIVARTIAYEKP